jgi:hypothetical protein
MGIFSRKHKGEERVMGYELEGRMSEVCSCAVYCPCWAGKDPDGGTCDFSWVFHFDRGQINGVDVAGLNMGFLGHLPGNVFDGNVRLQVVIDERASAEQQESLVAAFTGKVGGPLADLAGLVGEIVGVSTAPIEFDVDKGTGSFRVGKLFEGQVEGQRAPNGNPTMLTDTAVSPVLGTPAYPGSVTRFEVSDPEHGLEFRPGGATQTEFHYVTV